MRTFTLDGARPRHPEVRRWLDEQSGPLGQIARHWFDVIRSCGPGVREVMHDGQATACVGDVAFAYVAVYREHVNVGFFAGAVLPDPRRILQGTGRYMRHVKASALDDAGEGALTDLIHAAYRAAHVDA